MLTVKDIMTQPVAVIRSSATVEQAIGVMRAEGVRSLIVEKAHKDGSYGIVTEKDIVYNVIARGDDPSQVHVGSIMRQPCIQMPHNATMREAAQLLADSGIQRAPVVESNQLLGIVSVTDILLKGTSVTTSSEEPSEPVQGSMQYFRFVESFDDTPLHHEYELTWQVVEETHVNINTHVNTLS